MPWFDADFAEGQFGMANYLDVPNELLSLIEKRELEDRRLAERRDHDSSESGEPPVIERRENERRNEPARRESDRTDT